MQFLTMDNLTVNRQGKGSGHNQKQPDINDLLPDQSGKVYAMEVNSDIMNQIGIDKGDQVIVDREQVPSNGNIVVAKIGNDLCIRRLLIEEGRKTLISPGKSLAPLAVDPSFICWGVVIYVLKKML
jgi:SOS-response transcriptional repressor LexA